MTTRPELPTQPADITAFLTDLAREAKAKKTWRAYRSDLNLLASWAATTDDSEQAATTNDPEPAEPVERLD